MLVFHVYYKLFLNFYYTDEQTNFTKYICDLLQSKNKKVELSHIDWMWKEVIYSQNSNFRQKTMAWTKRPSSGVRLQTNV